MEDDRDVCKGEVRFVKPRACDIRVAVGLRKAAGRDREIIEGGEKYPVIGGEIRIEGEVEETEILGRGQRRQALQRRGEIARLVENAHCAGQPQDQKDISVRQKSEAVGHVHIVEQHCHVEGCGPVIRRAGLAREGGDLVGIVWLAAFDRLALHRIVGRSEPVRARSARAFSRRLSRERRGKHRHTGGQHPQALHHVCSRKRQGLGTERFEIATNM